jgi:hypothetical protein
MLYVYIFIYIIQGHGSCTMASNLRQVRLPREKLLKKERKVLHLAGRNEENILCRRIALGYSYLKSLSQVVLSSLFPYPNKDRSGRSLLLPREKGGEEGVGVFMALFMLC